MFKTALGLFLALFLFGDLLGLIGLVWVLFRDRDKGRVFWFFSGLLLAVTLFIFIWLSGAGEIPPEVRTLRYRWTVLAAAAILSCGVWPCVGYIIFGLWHEDEDKTEFALLSGNQPPDFWITQIAQIVRSELHSFFNGKPK